MKEKDALVWVKENIDYLKNLKDANEKDKYSPFDWFQNRETGAQNALRVEYKDRSNDFRSFSEGTLIEKKKLARMWYDRKFGICLYCITDSKGMIWFWNLTNMVYSKEINWVKQENCNDQTFNFGNGRQGQKVTKEVAYLPWSSAFACFDTETGERMTSKMSMS